MYRPMTLFVLAAASLLSVASVFAEEDGKRYVIIHADDAGMSHSVNRATIDALEKGAVSSASIMVPCPWFPEFAEYAAAHPEGDFGIHLTLNSEWEHYRWPPVAGKAKVPSMVDEQGYLWDNVGQVVANVKVEEAEIELRAQIERAKEFGVRISHLDPHMGAAVSRPDLAQLYVKLGMEYDVPVLFVRPTPQNKVEEQYPGALQLLPLFESRGMPLLDELYQFYERGAYDDRKAKYLTTLENLPPGVTEIIIHCGYDDAELQAISSSVTIRDSDRRIFMDPEVLAAIDEWGIELLTWRKFREMRGKKSGD